ncbi:Filamentous hemagglutinin [Bienertia sinuspersici]
MKGGIVYVGGEAKTHDVQVDELCYWDVINLAKELGPYDSVSGLFCLTPRMGMQGGLRKVDDDSAVRAMAKSLMKYRTIDLFVQHQETVPEFIRELEVDTQKHFQPLLTHDSQPSSPKKLTPKKGPASNQPQPNRPTNDSLKTGPPTTQLTPTTPTNDSLKIGPPTTQPTPSRPTNDSLKTGPPTTQPTPGKKNRPKKLSPKPVPAKTRPTATNTLRQKVCPPTNQPIALNTAPPTNPDTPLFTVD